MYKTIDSGVHADLTASHLIGNISGLISLFKMDTSPRTPPVFTFSNIFNSQYLIICLEKISFRTQKHVFLPQKPQTILCKLYVNFRCFTSLLFNPDSEAY